MFNKQILFAAALIAVVSCGSVKPTEKVAVTIQATNNTLVPNIVYTVDAVECLKQAYSIYVDEPSRAEAYLELFSVKHPGNWTVVAGYTTIISRSTIYIELSVKEGGKDFKSDKKGLLYRIMN